MRSDHRYVNVFLIPLCSDYSRRGSGRVGSNKFDPRPSSG